MHARLPLAAAAPFVGSAAAPPPEQAAEEAAKGDDARRATDAAAGTAAADGAEARRGLPNHLGATPGASSRESHRRRRVAEVSADRIIPQRLLLGMLGVELARAADLALLQQREREAGPAEGPCSASGLWITRTPSSGTCPSCCGARIGSCAEA